MDNAVEKDLKAFAHRAALSRRVEELEEAQEQLLKSNQQLETSLQERDARLTSHSS